MSHFVLSKQPWRIELNYEQNSLSEIVELRKEQDIVNERLVDLLKKRFYISNQILTIKSQIGYAEEDLVRESEIFALIQKTTEISSEKYFLNEIFKTILSETKKHWKESLNRFK